MHFPNHYLSLFHIFNSYLYYIKYLKKGDKVYLEGKLKTRKWQAEDGQQRYSTEVHVNEFNFLNNRSDAQPENTDNTVAQTPNPPQQENQADDLPF